MSHRTRLEKLEKRVSPNIHFRIILPYDGPLEEYDVGEAERNASLSGILIKPMPMDLDEYYSFLLKHVATSNDDKSA
ncbi:hypothetical protein DWB58_30100 [candidate division KSB1 bacterium]|nr:hypothetical protein [candidate division KSB1 bacterium]